MVAIVPTVKIDTAAWQRQFGKAVFVMLVELGGWFDDTIKTEVEGTWEHKFPVEKIVADDELIVIWGGAGDAPGEVSGGGDLMAIVPRGSQWSDVAKTEPGVLRSKATTKSWVAIQQVVGNIVPRNIDELLIEELEKNQNLVENFMNKGLVQAGLT